MGGFGVNLICHLEDLATDGVDEVLDRAQGELGVTGICLPAVTPTGSRLRVGRDHSLRIIHSKGGLMFNPSGAHYAATRCRPAPCTEFKSRDLFARVVEASRKRDLGCRAVVYAATAGRLVSQNPQAAAKTVFGDPWPERACLVNPDVQAFVAAVCDDLTAHHDLTGIELGEFHVGRCNQVTAGVESWLHAGIAGPTLLGICFCESCRQLTTSASDAAVDPEAAANSVRFRIECRSTSASGLAETAGEAPWQDAALCAYLSVQWRSLAAALGAIRGPDGCDLIVRVYDDAIIPSGRAGRAPLEGAGRRPDAIVAAALSGDHKSAEHAAEVALTQAQGSARAEVLMRAYPPDGDWYTAGPALVKTLPGLAERGIGAVELDNYGAIAPAGLGPIRQAVRFARRSSGALTAPKNEGGDPLKGRRSGR